jgi:3-oxoacyl-[acyl-carrier-protein] synthase II
VKGFDPSSSSKKEIQKMDIFIHYAMAAAHFAMEDAGGPVTDENRERFAVVVGSGIGGLPIIEETQRKYVEQGNNPRVISPFFITGLIVNEAGGNISIKYGLKGPNLATVTACTTGAHAVGEAYRMIQYGDADTAIAGGAEVIIRWQSAGSASALDPQRRPRRRLPAWDRDRDGFVIAEGWAWSLRRWKPPKARRPHLSGWPATGCRGRVHRRAVRGRRRPGES